MRDRTPEEIYNFIDEFYDLDDMEPKADDVVTFYCDHKDEQGFVVNVKWCEGGFDKLIARKWILQSELDRLFDDHK